VVGLRLEGNLVNSDTRWYFVDREAGGSDARPLRLLRILLRGYLRQKFPASSLTSLATGDQEELNGDVWNFATTAAAASAAATVILIVAVELLNTAQHYYDSRTIALFNSDEGTRGEIWKCRILFGVISGICKKPMKNMGNRHREIIYIRAHVLCSQILKQRKRKDVFGLQRCAKVRHV